MQLVQINTEHDDDDYEALSHIVHEMQVTATFSNDNRKTVVTGTF
jgi:hypothetical protein